MAGNSRRRAHRKRKSCGAGVYDENMKLKDIRDEDVIGFERRWARVFDPRAAKITRNEDIRRTFGIAPGRYYLFLASRLKSESFFRLDPVLADRLKRLCNNQGKERQRI